MSALLDLLRDIVGEAHVLTGTDVSNRPARFAHPMPNTASAIVRPRTTEEVSTVLAACHKAGQPVIPLGGNTNMTGSAAALGSEILLSLERMRSIEAADPAGRTMAVEAGATLESVQKAADAAGFLFPLDLGARGTATVGGAIATNAGGNGVIRYGMMREQVLGLEAVLADGAVLSGMNRVLKNNTGYDLKQLFIGSEGTLGVVTRAVLRLRPKPVSLSTAILAVPDFRSVTELLNRLDGELGGGLTAFEVMWSNFWTLMAGDSRLRMPAFSGPQPFYVLIESRGAHMEKDHEQFETVLGGVLEAGLAADAVIAKSETERAGFWAIRDNIPRLASLWPFAQFDISIPLGEMEAYCAELEEKLKDYLGEPKYVVFGHLGDANIHVIVNTGGPEPERLHAIERIVYDAVAPHHGSISAEHGIGIDKRDFLHLSRTPEEIAAMKAIKAALDPRGILNPGKIFA